MAIMDGTNTEVANLRNRRCTSHIRRYLTVEPVLASFMFCVFLVAPIEEQLIYRKTCFHLFNDSICENALHSKDKIFRSYENLVQKETSKLLIYKNIVITLPSVLSTLCLSSISDRVGRKFLMVLPFIGSTLQAIGLIVNSYYMRASVPYIFIGSAVAGFFGNFACVLASVFSYIADISSKESRTLRVSILEAMVFVGGACGEIVGGLVLDYVKSGFILTFSIALAVYLTAILYILLYVRESHFPQREETLMKVIMSKEHLLHVVKVTGRKRENSRRMFVLILLAVFTCQVLVFVGSSEISILYVLHQPLHWAPSLLGYFLAAGMIMKGCGVLVGMPILLKKFGLEDYTIIIGGLLSTISMYIIFGFASKTWVMFFATIVGIGSGAPAPCIRSMLTKIVDRSEQGSLMAAVACFDVLATLLAHLIFDGVYYGTVEWYPGFSFFVMATLLVLPLLVTWFLQSRHRSGVTYVSVNEDMVDSDSNGEGVSRLSENPDITLATDDSEMKS